MYMYFTRPNLRYDSPTHFNHLNLSVVSLWLSVHTRAYVNSTLSPAHPFNYIVSSFHTEGHFTHTPNTLLPTRYDHIPTCSSYSNKYTIFSAHELVGLYLLGALSPSPWSFQHCPFFCSASDQFFCIFQHLILLTPHIHSYVYTGWFPPNKQQGWNRYSGKPIIK